jgi:rhodanese-related sulfurtransferase
MHLPERLKKLFTADYPTIDVTTAKAMLDRQRAVLLDVRELSEWNAGHAPHARHIPLGAIGARPSEVPTDRPVITVCQSGMRSRRAAAQLTRHGIDVHNLRGGMHAWSTAGLPVTSSHRQGAAGWARRDSRPEGGTR